MNKILKVDMKVIVTLITLLAMCTDSLVYGQQDIPLTIKDKNIVNEKSTEQTIVAPGSQESRIVYNVNLPSLSVFKPEGVSSNGIGVLVVPGGAFHILAYDDEGVAIAKVLAAKGYTAAVLKYRLVKLDAKNPFEQLDKNSGNFAQLEATMAPIVPLAIEDGKTAMRYLKEHAAHLGFSADKIGVIGFSAGGTIAGALALDADIKPLFSAPIYPYLNPIIDQAVPNNPTPIFVSVTQDDDFGFDINSLKFYEKWKTSKGLAELHVYTKGHHGFANKKQGFPVDDWMDRFTEWLLFMGFSSK